VFTAAAWPSKFSADGFRHARCGAAIVGKGVDGRASANGDVDACREGEDVDNNHRAGRLAELAGFFRSPFANHNGHRRNLYREALRIEYTEYTERLGRTS